MIVTQFDHQDDFRHPHECRHIETTYVNNVYYSLTLLVRHCLQNKKENLQCLLSYWVLSLRGIW